MALVAWLMEAKVAVEVALDQTSGDEMFKGQKDRCAASMEQARAKLAYAWNVLAPFIEK